MGILFFVLCTFVYALGGVFTATLFDDHYPGTDKEAAMMMGSIFWPVTAMIFLSWLLVKGVKNIKLPAIGKAARAERKVLAYAKTPTKVLTEIVCSRILAYPEGLDTLYDRWISKDRNIKIRATCYSSHCSFRSLEVNGHLFHDLGTKEKQKIEKTLHETYKLQREKRAAKEKADAQLAALQAVEALLLTPIGKEEERIGNG